MTTLFRRSGNNEKRLSARAEERCSVNGEKSMVIQRTKNDSFEISVSSRQQVDLDALNLVASGNEPLFCRASYTGQGGRHVFRYQADLSSSAMTRARRREFQTDVEILGACCAVIKAVRRSGLLLENVKWDLKQIPYDGSGYRFIYLPLAGTDSLTVKALLLKFLGELKSRDPRVAELQQEVRKSASDEESLAALEQFVHDFTPSLPGGEAEAETTGLDAEGETTGLSAEGETTALSPEECGENAADDSGGENAKYTYREPFEGETSLLNTGGNSAAGDETSLLSAAGSGRSNEGETSLLSPMGNNEKSDAPTKLYLVRSSTGERIPISGSCFMIGKDPESMDYVVDNGSVSRHHATITRDGDTYYIVDNRSTNGTAVEGVMLQPYEKTELYAGAFISMGTETFQVQAG